jgi:hypothetical protein
MRIPISRVRSTTVFANLAIDAQSGKQQRQPRQNTEQRCRGTLKSNGVRAHFIHALEARKWELRIDAGDRTFERRDHALSTPGTPNHPIRGSPRVNELKIGGWHLIRRDIDRRSRTDRAEISPPGALLDISNYAHNLALCVHSLEVESQRGLALEIHPCERLVNDRNRLCGCVISPSERPAF